MSYVFNDEEDWLHSDNHTIDRDMYVKGLNEFIVDAKSRIFSTIKAELEKDRISVEKEELNSYDNWYAGITVGIEKALSTVERIAKEIV